MSERLTTVQFTDHDAVTFHGRVCRYDAISRFREYHRREIEISQRALSATDAELMVHTYLGPYARRDIEEVTE